MERFRLLKANEIEARVSQVKENGIVLLLYKDSRCDMRLLDETVGPMNWQRDHKELKGNMYCGVGIYDKDRGDWTWKWDCGAETYTEAVKGEASDSFKRACFNWSIGRELYTAPFIWIGKDHCRISTGKNGKLACYDRFQVKDIKYKDNAISGLTIINARTRIVAYQWGECINASEDMNAITGNDELARMKNEFIARCTSNELSAQSVLEQAGWTREQGKATIADYEKANIILDELLGGES